MPAEPTIAVNIRLPEDVHRRLTERKEAGGPAINTQVVRALRDYDALADKHEALQRENNALQEQLAAAQLAHQQTLAQVEALMRLHAELSGQQFTQLAQALTEAHKSSMLDAAQQTARAVRRELRGPATRRRERAPARRGIAQSERIRKRRAIARR
jgi:hypothetical protein